MGSRKAPAVPEPTAQENAFARRSELSLDKEIDEENRRKRLLIRGTLGSASLLSGFNPSGGANGSKFSGTTFAAKSGGAKPSLLSGSSSGGSGPSAGFGGLPAGFTFNEVA